MAPSELWPQRWLIDESFGKLDSRSSSLVQRCAVCGHTQWFCPGSNQLAASKTLGARRYRRDRIENSVECFYYKTISSGKSAPLQERARGQRVLRREPPVGVDGEEPRQELVEVAVGLAVLAEGRHAPHMVSTVPG